MKEFLQDAWRGLPLLLCYSLGMLFIAFLVAAFPKVMIGIIIVLLLTFISALLGVGRRSYM